MDRVSVGGTISAAFGFIGTAWRRAPAALALIVAIEALTGLARFFGPQATSLTSLLLVIPSIALSTMAFAALYRVGVRSAQGDDPEFRLGPGGVQWNGVEWRVLGVNLLVGIAFVVCLVVVIMVWAIALGISMAGRLDELRAVSAATSNLARLEAFGRLMLGPGGVVTAVILLPAAVLFLWLNAKLSLFAIAAADTKSFDLGRAWALTGGAVWALALTWLLLGLTEIVVGAVMGFIGGAMVGLFGFVGFGSQAGALLGGVATTAITTPLVAGMQVHVYGARSSSSQTVASTFS